MNGEPAQFGIDYRTHRSTAIDFRSGSVSQRAACSAINRDRATGILEAAQSASSGQSISADVWNAAFAAESSRRTIPLISLEELGVTLDADGMLGSRHLRQLKPGAEASPFADEDAKVVYKLFDLRANGSLGKKVVIESIDPERLGVVTRDATLRDTLVKLRVLNDAGAHPTEIVGLSDDGGFLIAKQPFAGPYVDLRKDRQTALEMIRAVIPPFTRLNREIAVFWLDGEAWVLCDLHQGNIMRDREGKPTIIDALIGVLPDRLVASLPWAREAYEDSRALRLGLPRITRKAFGEDVSDDEL